MKYYTCLFTTLFVITFYFLAIAVATEIPEEIDIDSIKEPLAESVTLPEIKGGIPVEEVKEIVKEVEVDEAELDLLARLIQAEAGADWCTDELQRAVGSVVINRVDDSRYPETMREVIYQPGQYSTAKSGKIDKAATDRARSNAEYLLKNGSTLPKEIVFQANFKQGTVYKELQGVYFGK